MTITEAQRARRQASIGGSDQGAIWGVDPFRSAEDVRLSKVHDLDDLNPNHAMDLGNRFEDVIIDWLAEKRGFRVRRNVFRSRRTSHGEPLHASLDFEVIGKPEIGEVKFTHRLDEWGPDGDASEIPTRTFLQVQHNIHVADAERCHVAVLGFDNFTLQFRSYVVERDDEVIERLVARSVEWWERHVIGGEPCSGELANLETLARIPRDDEATVEVAQFLVDEYERASAAARDAEKLKNQAKAELVSALGDAAIGDVPDGRRVTYRSATRKAYTVEEKTYRTLRVQKAKKGND